jgi:hypothetical protein
MASPCNLSINAGRTFRRRFEQIHTVLTSHGHIRFELNILEPGTLWIDDIWIGKLKID